MITPPQSPVRDCLDVGSPKRVRPFSLGECPSPPRRRVPEGRSTENRTPVWMNDVQSRLSPSTPVVTSNMTPLNIIREGDQCRVKFFGSPDTPVVVKRTFFVGKSSKANPKGISPSGLKLVHPTDFERQMDSLEMRLPHCLSPIGVKSKVKGDVLKVTQLFPAGKPLNEYVQEKPGQIEILSQKWSRAILETIEKSRKLVCDPKPANAVVFERDGELDVKLIDFELISEDDVDCWDDIISGRYFVGEDCKSDIYTAAIQMGILDIQTGCSLKKEELLERFSRIQNYKKKSKTN